MPVTLDASQRRTSASRLIGAGSSGSSERSAKSWGGESANSEAIPSMSRRWENRSLRMAAQASSAGVRRAVVGAISLPMIVAS